MSSGDALAPAAERGRLDVRAKAIESMVRICAERHPDTGGGRGATVDLTLRGGRAWIAVGVGATWPCRAAEVATRVRHDLRSELERLSSVPVERLDVTLRVAARAP